MVGVTLLGGGDELSAQQRGRLSFEDHVANLKSPNAKTRIQAAAALGKSRRREAVVPLAVLVHDPEPKVRLEVVRALNALWDVSAVPALVTSLGDGETKIREEALSALVELYLVKRRSEPIDRFLWLTIEGIGNGTVVPAANVEPSVLRELSESLRDPNESVRAAATLALGILGGTAVKDNLSFVARNDPNAAVQSAAQKALDTLAKREWAPAAPAASAPPSDDRPAQGKTDGPAPTPRVLNVDATTPEATADSELANGIRKFHEGDFDGAVETFTSLVRRLSTDPARAKDLAQAYLFLGVTYTLQDNDKGARANFREALKLEPGLRLTSDRFPPRALRMFEAARAEPSQAK